MRPAALSWKAWAVALGALGAATLFSASWKPERGGIVIRQSVNVLCACCFGDGLEDLQPGLTRAFRTTILQGIQVRRKRLLGGLSTL